MITRRNFVQGFSGSAVLLGARTGWASPASPVVLNGPEFDLTIDEMQVNFTGAARSAIVVNGQLPAPLLRMRQGDTVTIRKASLGSYLLVGPDRIAVRVKRVK